MSSFTRQGAGKAHSFKGGMKGMLLAPKHNCDIIKLLISTVELRSGKSVGFDFGFNIRVGASNPRG